MTTNTVTDIRDIKGLVPLPGWPWWVWALIVLVVVLVIVLGWWLARRKPGLIAPPVIVPPTPFEVATDALRKLWADKPAVEIFYTRLSDIVRHYLEDQFALRAPERTTEEFLREMSTLKPEHQQLLGAFLQEADLVKFARLRPAEPEMKRAYDAAEQFVVETNAEDTTMSEQQEGKSLAIMAEIDSTEPIATKDRVVGIVIGVALVGFCVAVWIRPDPISIDASNFSGRGGRTLARILNLLWSQPVGTIAGVIGLVIAWGAATKKSQTVIPGAAAK